MNFCKNDPWLCKNLLTKIQLITLSFYANIAHLVSAAKFLFKEFEIFFRFDAFFSFFLLKFSLNSFTAQHYSDHKASDRATATLTTLILSAATKNHLPISDIVTAQQH